MGCIITKRILVTAALPYANGPLHLGHVRSTYLPADIYARYWRMRGADVAFICASDEHGTPIVAAAERERKAPGEFAAFYHEKDKREFGALGFSFDIFHRTSSGENREMTQHFFEVLGKRGFVYKKTVEQAYCENCKRFLPDRFIVGTCPHCGAQRQYSDYCENCGRALHAGELQNPSCITCGGKPSLRASEHYFFKLSAFSERLEKWLKGNAQLQGEVVNYVLDWIRNGLKDWDITRDLNWGVPVPGEAGKVFYVWFDAPIGYVSSTVAWAKQHGRDWEDFWEKPDAQIVHFIGKDIVYHHFLFWPAMLMGVAETQMPDAIPVRGYLNLEGRKFSKSRNWFVSLEDFLAAFPADYLRYYETAVTPHSLQDADFAWDDFQSKINNELVANTGNFVHRSLTLVKKLCDSKVPKHALGKDDERMLKRITHAKERVAQCIERFALKEGLEEIGALSGELNAYLSAREPWREKDRARVQTTLYVCTRGVTALAVLLAPYLPFSSQRLLAMLGLQPQKWDDADKELLAPGAALAEPKPLFARVEDEAIKRQKEKLKP